MTMLSMLLGTPYFLEDESWEDTLLFIEDVGEAPYKLDRMLQQFRLSGLLSRIKGLVLGTFTNCEGDEDEVDYDWAMKRCGTWRKIEILNYQNLLCAMCQQAMARRIKPCH